MPACRRQRPYRPDAAPAGTLGSKLKRIRITTDYAESLLEFITPPSQDPAFPLAFLRDIHRYTARQLPGEIEAGSMPCVVGDDKSIAIADYGTTNSARMKMIYREGLGLRYGRHMQTIAGAHYNWSLPHEFWSILKDCCCGHGDMQDFISERYFGLIRNFPALRLADPLPLRQASPAICRTFLQGRHSDLQELVPGTLYRPYATSLRMSDLGYQNRAQDQLHVSFDSLAAYTQALEVAIRTPDPFYEELGVRDGERWKQLNANLLQIENEFYAGIRPKRVGKAGERPALALAKYGVEYVEMRLFDLNPFVDIGVLPEQSTFADILLLMCLFRQSPPTAREQGENNQNKARIVNKSAGNRTFCLLVYRQP